jgi:superfamily II RNA helicase
MDNIGFALVLPGKFMDIKHIAKLIGMPASDVNSQIKINFSMVLNLLLSHSPDQIEYLLSKSFAAFQIHGASLSYIHLVKNFNRHLDFLKENGFVDKDGKLTEDGFWASKLRVDQPLLIAEAIRKNIFNKFNPALLAAAVSVFINEEENDFRIDRVYIPNNLFKAYKRIKNQLKPFQDILIKEGFEARTLYLRPMATIHAWVNGYSWDKIIDIAELEAGNLVMLILRTADNLRQLAGLREFFPDIAETAEKAVLSILRDPVVFED